MFCPSCGAEVPPLKFCENCGSPLPSDQQQGFDAQQTQPEGFASPAQPGGFATQSWQQEANVPPSGAPQAPYQQPDSAYQYQVTSQTTAPNAAFVLVIVGLVLSLLFVTFVPGVVCSIVGLVLNAGYNKKGMDNPRKTPTLVIGIIGIVVAVICLIATIMVGIVTAELIENGDVYGANPPAAVQSSSASSAQSETSGTSAIGSTIGESSSSASSSSAAPVTGNNAYDDPLYHDGAYNPTLYALTELTGSELQSMLEYYGFVWDDDGETWTASDGSMFFVENTSGELGKDQIAALPKGAAGQPVVMLLVVEGYDTAQKAFAETTSGVQVDAQAGIDDVYFGIVRNSDSARYLVAVADTGRENEQSILVFTEASVSSNLFSELVGADTGSSIDDVWTIINMLS